MRVIQKKICMVGIAEVGKTSLVRRYVYHRFQEKYLSTVGTTISRKEVQVETDTEHILVKLILWDLAGSEHLSTVTKSYLRGAAGAVMVSDLTRPESLSILVHHIKELQAINKAASFALVGNKLDLTDQLRVPESDLAALSHSYRAPYFMTSAKTGENVERMFYDLALRLVQDQPA